MKYDLYKNKNEKMLPLLPLLGYLIDIQCVIRGSIVKNAAPLLPHATPVNFHKYEPNCFTDLFSVMKTGSLQACFREFS